MRKLICLALILVLLVPIASADDDFRVHAGKHIGDKAPLEYEIVYTHASGTLTIDVSGCTYYFPQWNWYWRPACSYDDDYFGTYMVYFIGQVVYYEIHIKNIAARTYRNLRVTATQEYHEDLEGTDYTGYFSIEQGDPMPGSPTREWYVDKIGPGEEIVLRGEYYAPWGTHPGLDQTHLKVLHWKNERASENGGDAPGRVLIDDPTAGVYCPPEPIVAR